MKGKTYVKDGITYNSNGTVRSFGNNEELRKQRQREQQKAWYEKNKEYVIQYQSELQKKGYYDKYRNSTRTVHKYRNLENENQQLKQRIEELEKMLNSK